MIGTRSRTGNRLVRARRLRGKSSAADASGKRLRKRLSESMMASNALYGSASRG
jgi:hypothetical protein